MMTSWWCWWCWWLISPFCRTSWYCKWPVSNSPVGKRSPLSIPCGKPAERECISTEKASEYGQVQLCLLLSDSNIWTRLKGHNQTRRKSSHWNPACFSDFKKVVTSSSFQIYRSLSKMLEWKFARFFNKRFCFPCLHLKWLFFDPNPKTCHWVFANIPFHWSLS